QGTVPGLTLYEAYLQHGNRMIWQVVIDYSERTGVYTDVVRVWAIVHHDAVSREMEKLNDRFRSTIPDWRLYRKRLLTTQKKAGDDEEEFLPSIYEALDKENAEVEQQVQSQKGAAQDKSSAI